MKSSEHNSLHWFIFIINDYVFWNLYQIDRPKLGKPLPCSQRCFSQIKFRNLPPKSFLPTLGEISQIFHLFYFDGSLKKYNANQLYRSICTTFGEMASLNCFMPITLLHCRIQWTKHPKYRNHLATAVTYHYLSH